ncbi:hypothetical protein FVE85_4176 [Porphyridium purpureum]|uniref:Uncharacterized protein n=1 Tax=Porphyridium purpureum TaxID=35688 RepID=A0A5J4YRS9_PORPP|nr:hypothetical protein FVE85_4176 [Porphyridium purpureum]|eukprot:POR4050..scf229_5
MNKLAAQYSRRRIFSLAQLLNRWAIVVLVGSLVGSLACRAAAEQSAVNPEANHTRISPASRPTHPVGSVATAAASSSVHKPPWSSYLPSTFVHHRACESFGALLDQGWTTHDLELRLVQMKESIVKMKSRELSLRRRQLSCLFWQLHDAHKLVHMEMGRKLIEFLKETMMVYWRVYRDRSRKKLWMYHFHISKAGGTSFCNLARRNGCMVPGLGDVPEQHRLHGRNCFTNALDDGTSWNPANVGAMSNANEHARSCTMRKDLFARFGITYEANEKWASEPDDDPTCSEHALSFLVLRDPVERAVSMVTNASPALRRHRECIGIDPKNRSRSVFDPDCVLEHKFYATDNYQVRMLGGFRAANRPLGGVMIKDVKQAMVVARMVDTLFIQHGGEPRYRASDAAHLSLALGFDVYRGFNVNTSRERHLRTDFMFTEQHYATLTERNKREYGLFRYAKALWDLDHFLMHHTERVCTRLLPPGTSDTYYYSITCRKLRADVDPLRQNNGMDLGLRGMWRPAACGCGFIGMTHKPRPECLDVFDKQLPG